MKEELSKNEDIVFTRQNDKVKGSRGNATNSPRRNISTAGIILGLVLVLGALCLWLLRLLGWVGFGN